MKLLHVAVSPITNRIFCGYVAKNGREWLSKTDVTRLACGAVAQYIIANNGEVIISVNGVPKFEISVKQIDTNHDAVL